MTDKKDVFDTKRLTELVNLDIRGRLLDPDVLGAVVTVMRMANTCRAALLRVADELAVEQAVNSAKTVEEAVAEIRQNILYHSKSSAPADGPALIVEGSP